MAERSRPLILIADDETHILHVLSLRLSRAGYEVITAEDGATALDLVARHAPRLLITDLQMPGLGGLELCRRLDERDPEQNMPALLLTARGMGLRESDLSGTRVRGVISKPFSPNEIMSRVRDLVGAAQEKEVCEHP
ncbi:MAG: response regulator [Phycisphaeraceae bacterium]|nr:response regulator [Phycisphaeraceae bacterium]